jgi:hypothetical protein
VITFNFTSSPGNHSVTQSSFDTPCNPLSGGFDSGTVFIPQGVTQGFPTWNLTVTNATSRELSTRTVNLHVLTPAKPSGSSVKLILTALVEWLGT